VIVPRGALAASLWELLAKVFTMKRLGVPPSLLRCLVSANVIESPHSRDTKDLPRRDGSMVLRWVAAALLMTEQQFREIMGGTGDLWVLKEP
jgi:hypothetical protein